MATSAICHPCSEPNRAKSTTIVTNSMPVAMRLPIVSKMKDDLKATKKDTLLGVRIMAANDFKTKTEEYTMKAAAAATPGLRRERKYLKPGRDVAGATEAFWKSRQKAVWEESVPKEEFPGFAAALKQMPIVQYLLTPRKERSSKAATGGWKDG